MDVGSGGRELSGLHVDERRGQREPWIGRDGMGAGADQCAPQWCMVSGEDQRDTEPVQ
jgi:hypothetical protein